MNCLKRLQRFLASVVLVTFFVTNTLTPAPVAHASSELFGQGSQISNFTIPAEFGKVTDIISAPLPGDLQPAPHASPILIHIQDAHANYDAQQNIKNILGHLTQDYGVKLILVEGAANKLQPERFGFFPKDKELNRAITDSLMKVGQLTGAEVFMIDRESATRNGQRATGESKALSVVRSTSSSPEAYGVENADAYIKDREAYKEVYEGRATADKFLQNYFLSWQKQAGLHINKDLRDFLVRQAAFEEEHIPLQDWLEALRAHAQKHLKIDFADVREQVEWPVLVRYFRLKETGSKIDAVRAEQEKEQFLRDIQAPLNAQPALQAARNEDVAREVEQIFEASKKHDLPIYKTRFVFERLMDALPQNFSFAAYPSLRLYIQQIILTSELDADRLKSELRELTKRVVEKLAVKPEEKRLAGLLREYQLLRKLFHLELSREEYQQVTSRNIAPKTMIDEIAFAQRETQGQNVVRGALSVAPEINALFKGAVNFYSLAITRENFMMQHAAELLAKNKDKKAVLITGGFHTQGLKEKIVASGSSYIGITPAIGEIRAEDEKNYLKALLGSWAMGHAKPLPSPRLSRGERDGVRGRSSQVSSLKSRVSERSEILAALAGDPGLIEQVDAADPGYAEARRAEMRETGKQIIATLRAEQFPELWPQYNVQLAKAFLDADTANWRFIQGVARRNIELELAERGVTPDPAVVRAEVREQFESFEGRTQEDYIAYLAATAKDNTQPGPSGVSQRGDLKLRFPDAADQTKILEIFSYLADRSNQANPEKLEKIKQISGILAEVIRSIRSQPLWMESPKNARTGIALRFQYPGTFATAADGILDVTGTDREKWLYVIRWLAYFSFLFGRLYFDEVQPRTATVASVEGALNKALAFYSRSEVRSGLASEAGAARRTFSPVEVHRARGMARAFENTKAMARLRIPKDLLSEVAAYLQRLHDEYRQAAESEAKTSALLSEAAEAAARLSEDAAAGKAGAWAVLYRLAKILRAAWDPIWLKAAGSFSPELISQFEKLARVLSVSETIPEGVFFPSTKKNIVSQAQRVEAMVRKITKAKTKPLRRAARYGRILEDPREVLFRSLWDLFGWIVFEMSFVAEVLPELVRMRAMDEPALIKDGVYEALLDPIFAAFVFGSRSPLTAREKTVLQLYREQADDEVLVASLSRVTGPEGSRVVPSTAKGAREAVNRAVRKAWRLYQRDMDHAEYFIAASSGVRRGRSEVREEEQKPWHFVALGGVILLIMVGAHIAGQSGQGFTIPIPHWIEKISATPQEAFRLFALAVLGSIGIGIGIGIGAGLYIKMKGAHLSASLSGSDASRSEVRGKIGPAEDSDPSLEKTSGGGLSAGSRFALGGKRVRLGSPEDEAMKMPAPATDGLFLSRSESRTRALPDYFTKDFIPEFLASPESGLTEPEKDAFRKIQAGIKVKAIAKERGIADSGISLLYTQILRKAQAFHDHVYQKPPIDPERLDEMPLERLGHLSPRVDHALRNSVWAQGAAVITVGAIIAHWGQMTDQKGIGTQTLEKLRQFLARHGIVISSKSSPRSFPRVDPTLGMRTLEFPDHFSDEDADHFSDELLASPDSGLTESEKEILTRIHKGAKGVDLAEGKRVTPQYVSIVYGEALRKAQAFLDHVYQKPPIDPQKLDETPLERIGHLSSRTRTALVKNFAARGVTTLTLGTVLKQWKTLPLFKQFGHDSMEDLSQALKRHGILVYNDGSVDFRPAGTLTESGLVPLNVAKLDQTPLSWLGPLSSRLFHVLSNYYGDSVITVGAILADWKKMPKFRGMGVKMLEELRQVLARNGIIVKDDGAYHLEQTTAAIQTQGLFDAGETQTEEDSTRLSGPEEILAEVLGWPVQLVRNKEHFPRMITLPGILRKIRKIYGKERVSSFSDPVQDGAQVLIEIKWKKSGGSKGPATEPPFWMLDSVKEASALLMSLFETTERAPAYKIKSAEGFAVSSGEFSSSSETWLRVVRRPLERRRGRQFNKGIFRTDPYTRGFDFLPGRSEVRETEAEAFNFDVAIEGWIRRLSKSSNQADQALKLWMAYKDTDWGLQQALIFPESGSLEETLRGIVKEPAVTLQMMNVFLTLTAFSTWAKSVFGQMIAGMIFLGYAVFYILQVAFAKDRIVREAVARSLRDFEAQASKTGEKGSARSEVRDAKAGDAENARAGSLAREQIQDYALQLHGLGFTARQADALYDVYQMAIQKPTEKREVAQLAEVMEQIFANHGIDDSQKSRREQKAPAMFDLMQALNRIERQKQREREAAEALAAAEAARNKPANEIADASEIPELAPVRGSSRKPAVLAFVSAVFLFLAGLIAFDFWQTGGRDTKAFLNNASENAMRAVNAAQDWIRSFKTAPPAVKPEQKVQPAESSSRSEVRADREWYSIGTLFSVSLAGTAFVASQMLVPIEAALLWTGGVFAVVWVVALIGRAVAHSRQVPRPPKVQRETLKQGEFPSAEFIFGKTGGFAGLPSRDRDETKAEKRSRSEVREGAEPFEVVVTPEIVKVEKGKNPKGAARAIREALQSNPAFADIDPETVRVVKVLFGGKKFGFEGVPLAGLNQFLQATLKTAKAEAFESLFFRVEKPAPEAEAEPVEKKAPVKLAELPPTAAEKPAATGRKKIIVSANPKVTVSPEVKKDKAPVKTEKPKSSAKFAWWAIAGWIVAGILFWKSQAPEKVSQPPAATAPAVPSAVSTTPARSELRTTALATWVPSIYERVLFADLMEFSSRMKELQELGRKAEQDAAVASYLRKNLPSLLRSRDASVRQTVTSLFAQLNAPQTVPDVLVPYKPVATPAPEAAEPKKVDYIQHFGVLGWIARIFGLAGLFALPIIFDAVNTFRGFTSLRTNTSVSLTAVGIFTLVFFAGFILEKIHNAKPPKAKPSESRPQASSLTGRVDPRVSRSETREVEDSDMDVWKHEFRSRGEMPSFQMSEGVGFGPVEIPASSKPVKTDVSRWINDQKIAPRSEVRSKETAAAIHSKAEAIAAIERLKTYAKNDQITGQLNEGIRLLSFEGGLWNALSDLFNGIRHALEARYFILTPPPSHELVAKGQNWYTGLAARPELSPSDKADAEATIEALLTFFKQNQETFAAKVTKQDSETQRSEVRAAAAEQTDELEDYTILSRQLEAGLDRTLLEALNKTLSRRFQSLGSMIRRYVGLVAETTLTGGLGALMHDLFPSWAKNFGPQNKTKKDIIAVNIIYERIKGQRYAKYLPDEVRQGKKTLGGYLRSVLKADATLALSFDLDVGDDFRRKASDEEAWAEREGSPDYKDMVRKAKQIIGQKVHVDVYPTETHFAQAPNYYINAYFENENGERIQIFDEVYPDAPHGRPNLWRDVHMAVYGWSTQYLAQKLQKKGVINKKLLFVDNEVFVSTPTPLYPQAIHHHINHTVFRPGLYMPEEASFEMLGYQELQRKYIVKNGKIDIVNAVGISSHLITGVALYEHTPVLAGDIMAPFVDKLKSYNEGGVRNTNGVLIEQWQSPILQLLIEQYKEKAGLAPEASDKELLKAFRTKENAAALNEFERKAEFAKAVHVMELLLWLKTDQGKSLWFDSMVAAYREYAGLQAVDDQKLVEDFRRTVESAVEDPAAWHALTNDPNMVFLRDLLLKDPIISNVRRQVSYKGPDKWLEILRGLERNPAALANFKANGPRIIMGGREFGKEAHAMFLEIQALVERMGLQDRFVTIDDYNNYIAPIIFQGVAGSVMLSDEFLEASATSMMKAMANMAALIGVWGGADPELFTIVEVETGREVDIFKEGVTHKQLVANMKEGKWRITNGFLIEYSQTEYSSQQGGGRRPSADSLLQTLFELNYRYRDGESRRDLQFSVLASTPKVDMVEGQAKAHKELWKQTVRMLREENAFFAKLKISPEDAKAILSKSLTAGSPAEFTWFKNEHTVAESRPVLGLLGFIEGLRYLRMKGRDSYDSIYYHAFRGTDKDEHAEGDIFAFLKKFFKGLDPSLAPVIQKIEQLSLQAQATLNGQERVIANMEALAIAERFSIEVSVAVFEHFVRTHDASLEPFLANPLVRENLVRYFDEHATPFKTLSKKMPSYVVSVDGEKYIAVMDLGEFAYQGKAWSKLYGAKGFEALLGAEAAKDESRIYRVRNPINGEKYDEYTLWKMTTDALSIGVPYPGVQLLQLKDTGKKSEEQEAGIQNDVLHYLEALSKGRFISDGRPVTQLLFQNIKNAVEDPEKLARLLRGVAILSPDEAARRFGKEGIPPVMAFVATLSPELLDIMKDWNPAVHEQLNGILHHPDLEKLFREGSIWFHRTDNDNAMVLLRSISSNEKQHVMVPIFFAEPPRERSVRPASDHYDQEGKVWFRIMDVAHLSIEDTDEMKYQFYNLVLKEFYDPRTGAKFFRDKCQVGVPVKDSTTRSGKQQKGYRFQFLEMRQAHAARSETRASSQTPLAESRGVANFLKRVASEEIQPGTEVGVIYFEHGPGWRHIFQGVEGSLSAPTGIQFIFDGKPETYLPSKMFAVPLWGQETSEAVFGPLVSKKAPAPQTTVPEKLLPSRPAEAVSPVRSPEKVIAPAPAKTDLIVVTLQVPREQIGKISIVEFIRTNRADIALKVAEARGTADIGSVDVNDFVGYFDGNEGMARSSAFRQDRASGAYLEKVKRGIVTLRYRRSEVREAAATFVEPLEPVLTYDNFIRRYTQVSRASKEAMWRLTVEVMNGIAPLLAHTFNAADAVVARLPASLARTASDKLMLARFASARTVLGVKTVQAGDAFILGREFALGRGFLAAVRTILGDAPVAVIARDATDRAFIEKFNAGLEPDRRIIIASETDLLGAVAALRKQIKTERMNLKALLYGAETLKDQLSDITVQRILPQMFQRFLNLAGLGVNQMVSAMQAQYQATARSA